MTAVEMKIGKPVHKWQLQFEGDWPTSIAFVGDSSTIVAGNRAGQILLWRLPQQTPITKLPNQKDAAAAAPPNCDPARKFIGHTNSVTHLRPLPDGLSFVSSSLDHSIRLWKVDSTKTGTERIVLDESLRKRKAARSRKEDREKIMNAPGVELETTESIHEFNQHAGWVFGLDVDGAGKRMVTGDDQCLSVVWDLQSQQPISKWHGYDRVWVRSTAISPDGKTVFTCEFAGRRSSFDAPAAQARLWDAQTGKLKLDLLKVWTPKTQDKDRGDTYAYMRTWSKLMKRGLVCAAFAPDGKTLAVGQGGETDTGKIHLVDVETGQIKRTVSGHRYGVCDVKFSADGQYVLSSGRDTSVRICQVSDGKEVAVLGKARGGQFKDWIHAIAVSPDQKLIAGADIAGLVHVWELS